MANNAKNDKDKSNENESNEVDLDTELSIPTTWNLTSEDRYVYAFHNNQSPKLKVNQLSIYGIELFEKGNGFEATGLIRNTVPQGIQFNPTVIFLLGPDGEALAKKEFDLDGLGTLPPNSSRPWKFLFSKEDIVEQFEFPLDSWSLAFEIKAKHQLDLEESWEKSIAEDTKKSLQKIIDDAQPLKPGEVNFMGISIKQKEDRELTVTVLIRNGTEKNINFEQIPLAIKDATGNEVAKGSFNLKDFEVKANTSKPWSFIFPPSMVIEEDIDLSRWTAYVVQN